VTEVALVVLGAILGFIPAYFERRRRMRAHWAALRAEAEICGRMAQAYLTDGVAAPLYRLPEAAFSVSFPALLADGALGTEETTELAGFWAEVQTINRGLDNANTALNSQDSQRLASEAGRLKLKCQQLLGGQIGSGPSLAATQRLLARHAA
jgi:hypothetical protein